MFTQGKSLLQIQRHQNSSGKLKKPVYTREITLTITTPSKQFRITKETCLHMGNHSNKYNQNANNNKYITI